MKEKELYWLAGILEGEGCFLTRKDKDGHIKSWGIECSMTDEDIIRKIYSIYQGGRLTYTEPKNPKHKPQWRWCLNKRKHLDHLLPELLPLMGSRRSNRIKEMLKEMEERSLQKIYRKKILIHGTLNGYQYYDCRCYMCKEASRLSRSFYRSLRENTDL